MPIIYLCPTGTYASLVAANLHLGQINREAKINEILNLPNFGAFPGKVGMFLYIGKDRKGNLIYTLGTSNEAQLIIKSTYDLLRFTGYPENNLKLIDVSKYVPKHLVWCNGIFLKYGNKFIAEKLHKKLAYIDEEVKEIRKQGH
ncbi:MAG: hypothetical protein PWQ67_1334 [Clostridia bacterium]|jgi:hypothetical protein|nr:hypothetical protein [Clostridia bacterium]MDN5322880.1 hypothetical protein [Clostridia bacterium]